MKQRLQKLVVLGLAVATVAGSSVPAYAAEIVPNANVEATAEVPTTEEEVAEIVPNANVEATAEVPTTEEEVAPEDEQKPEGENGEENPNEDTQAPTVQATATWNGSGDAEVPTTEEEVAPEDEQKPEGENGEENPNEDTQAPTVQATATWNGSGDVVLQFNPNGLTEGSYFGCDAGIYFGDAETGYNADEPEVVVDYEAGTITVPEASLKAMIKSVEAWLEEAGNPQKFESGTGELIFYFDADEDGNYDYDILSTIAMTVKDEGTTDPEQKPDGDEAKRTET